METQQLVTLIPWTFIAQILNLFIQLYLIKRFLFKPVNEILDKRRKLADKEIREARSAQEEADSLRLKYEDSLSSAQEQADRIVSDAKTAAEDRADRILKQAEIVAAGIRSKAEADIEQEKRHAVNEARNEIGSLAMDIAGKVVEKEINEADHKKLIEDFIKQVGEAS